MSRYIHTILPSLSARSPQVGEFSNVVIFEEDEIYYFHSVEAASVQTKLNLVGVISGLEALGSTFKTGHEDDYMTVETDGGCIVAVKEAGITIAATLVTQGGHNATTTEHSIVALQAASVLRQGWQMFMFTTGTPHDRTKLAPFFDSLFERYNNRCGTWSPSGANNLHYRGFLGFLSGDKWSTITDIDLSLPELTVGGLVANFDSTSFKQYGVVAGTSFGPLYTWLEFYHYYHQLHDDIAEDQVGNASITSAWATPYDGVALVGRDDSTGAAPINDENGADDDTVSTYSQYFSPATLTNNLVVAPLNYTVSSIRNVPDTLINLPSSTSKWWQGKGYFGGGSGSADEAASAPPMASEAPGQFLIGRRDAQNITKKRVFLADDKGDYQPHRLVVYVKKSVVVALLYPDNVNELDSDDIYDNIQKWSDTVVGDVNEAKTNLGTSFGVLPAGVKSDPDADFFFVVYNHDEHWFQSSLPYLPPIADSASTGGDTASKRSDSPESHEPETVPSPPPRVARVLVSLHDQLSSVIIGDKLLQNGAYEYFHKFSGSGNHDWMFYLVKQGPTVAIVVKNQSTRRQAKRGEPVEPSVLANLPNPLGFLDNLGDDVKGWLSYYAGVGADATTA
ncbi:hypothetical protein DIURU_002513 [Diutina rugosa]|uniref:CCZ1/INTU/HSP4 first Longin domain-containing protein n=1 Tax=Diutina rugosa TaxID=5481 RepID=A0A642UPP3_DIURU|nr:uncharacterized protein DIURU_002513 [Diutina rugosa]KAA8903226.1 hypothetical protein DIURU_002513 [Diutina rugosa]